MLEFFHTILVVPLYNLLIALVDVVPGGDLGLSVVIATIIVKIAILPLTLAAVKTQRAMKLIEPKLKELQAKHKDNKELLAKEMFALYREYKVRPLASIGAVLIQIPILICLYVVFQMKSLSTVDTSLLYSFVPVPTSISTEFLGLLTIAGTSIILAALAAITQAGQAFYAIPVPEKKEGSTAQEDFARAMSLQMRFVLPLVIGFAALTSGAIALYFITSNLFGIAQEFFVRRFMPQVKV